MSARHAVLGMLLDGPTHQYEVGDRLRRKLGATWEINSGHLSKTIRNLQADGLISFMGADQRDRRRLVYEITKDGVLEVERWWSAKEIPESHQFRQILLLKLALAGPAGLEEMNELCAYYEQHWVRRITELSRKRGEVWGGALTVADDVLLGFALAGEIYLLEANLKLARQARTVIGLQLSEAAWPVARRVELGNGEGLRSSSSQLFGRMAARDVWRVADTEEPGR